MNIALNEFRKYRVIKKTEYFILKKLMRKINLYSKIPLYLLFNSQEHEFVIMSYKGYVDKAFRVDKLIKYLKKILIFLKENTDEK